MLAWYMLVWDAMVCQLLMLSPAYVCCPCAEIPLVLLLLQDEEGSKIAGPEFSAELAAELDQYGAAVGAPGQWASCVRIVDPAGGAGRLYAEDGPIMSVGLRGGGVAPAGPGATRSLWLDVKRPQ